MTDTMNPVNQAQTKSESLASDDFIMSPMVDVCFVNLMRNPIVRKGFCAAVLRISPDMINETEFLPRYLEQEYADDKLGILDFIRFPEDKKCYRTIRFYDEESKELYNDKLELQILELKKLPEEIKTGEDIVNWMRFF